MRNYNALYVPFMRAIMALIFCSQGLSMAIAQEEEREYVPFVEMPILKMTISHEALKIPKDWV